jgi:trimethylamine corrinoid protein
MQTSDGSSVLDFARALLDMNRVAAKRLFDLPRDPSGGGAATEELVVPALEYIGTGWEAGRFSLSQVYMASRICEELVATRAVVRTADGEALPAVAIGALLDHHGLGKRIVTSVLRAAAYRVLDYGEGLTVPEMASQALADQVPVLLVSTLMLPSALKVRNLREFFDAAPHAPKLVVGGAPFRLDPTLGSEVGADRVGRTASDALAIVNALLGSPS